MASSSSSSVLVMFLLSTVVIISIMINVEAQRSHSKSYNISLDSSLSPNTNLSSWLSPSGRFAFGFYPQGNGFAVGIWLVNQANKQVVVWTANRDDPPVSSNSSLTLKSDGMFLVTDHGQHRREIPVANFSTPAPNSVSSTTYTTASSPSPAISPASSAAMLDSGNFVVYDSEFIVIWESFGFPTDTILGGQNLYAYNELVSSASISNHSSGRFLLEMQYDGNLVAYLNSSTISERSENAYWSSGTAGNDMDSNVLLRLDLSGFLVLLVNNSRSESGGVLKIERLLTLANDSYHGQNGTVIHRATLDVDGIFRLYRHSNASSRAVMVAWSALQNQCEVKGTCGLNSYCTLLENKAYCKCYPGFINSTDTFLGCYRNASDDGCTGNPQDSRLRFKLAEIENVWWGDYPYAVVSLKKQQLCSDSCLEDCNCRAVLYTIANSSCNKFKLPLRYGRISKNISEKGFIKIALGNVGRPNHTVPVGGMRKNESNKNSMLLILAVSQGSIACMCFVFAVSSFALYKHRLHRYQKLLEYTKFGLADQECFTLQSFSYTELEEATDGFKEELGRGSFGAVYKGTLSGSGNKIVAVKRLEKVVEEGVREFKAEITTIGRTHHRNLVQLLGFCIEGSRKLLVYEYMSNGSLADLLFKAKGVRPSWKERVGLVLDVAKGVLYLHDECSVHTIHCNLKPQNILLDHTWTGKISDFGFARLLVPNETKINPTGGVHEQRKDYSAPEWKKNALISVKADVYSFGIVLLEIVCCRRQVNLPTPDEIILSGWVYKCFAAGELDKLVEMDENVDLKTLERMVKVGLWCVQDDPALRPFMKNVILMLEGTMDIPVPPSPELPHFV